MVDKARRNLFSEFETSVPDRIESPPPDLSPDTAKIVYAIDIYTPIKSYGNCSNNKISNEDDHFENSSLDSFEYDNRNYEMEDVVIPETPLPSASSDFVNNALQPSSSLTDTVPSALYYSDELQPLPSLDAQSVLYESDDDSRNISIEENAEKSEDGENETSRLKKEKKKSTRDEKSWKRNMVKRARECGKAYIGHNRKFFKARKSKGKCKSNKCCFQCEDTFSLEDREEIFSRFWKLTDEKKNHFYAKFVEISPPKRKRTKREQSQRSNSFKYFFENKNVRHQVCRQFFLSTLDIDKQRIYYFFKHRMDFKTGVAQTPQKGKYQKKIIDLKYVNGVKQHIESFPTVDSHYCRSTSSKRYLEPNLNIKTMYYLYERSPYVYDENPVKEHKYREIFKKDFNLDFLKPRKDLCDLCEHQKSDNNSNISDEKRKETYLAHINKKKEAKMERDIDRTIDLKKNKTAVICFDLENVLCLPKTSYKKFFYKKKLQVYNMTAHCSYDKTAYCAIWHEALAGRTANHMASAVSKILKTIVKNNPDIGKIILWSDSCVSQNKNKMMSMALLHFLNSEVHDVQIIIQKYSEAGHSNIQEVDAVHSKIERFLKYTDIFSPVSLIQQLKKMPNRNIETHIIQMTEGDFLDYETATINLNFKIIPYSKVVYLKYIKNCEIINFRTKFTETEQMGNLLQITSSSRRLMSKRKRDISFVETCQKVFPVKANPSLNILNEKATHIESMLHVMPQIDKSYYIAIFGKYFKNTNMSQV